MAPKRRFVVMSHPAVLLAGLGIAVAGASGTTALRDALAGSAPAQALAAMDGAGRHAEDRYAVRIVGPPSARVGRASTARIEVRAASPWHMNLDFPTSLHLQQTAAAQVANPRLRKGDADRLDERGVVFSVRFTPKVAGSAQLHGRLKFAVCQRDACAPIAEKVVVSFDAAPVEPPQDRAAR